MTEINNFIVDKYWWNGGLCLYLSFTNQSHHYQSESSSFGPVDIFLAKQFLKLASAMSSSIQRRLYQILDVVLRVPPLFIMDSIFVNDMKLPQFYDSLSSTLFNTKNYPISESQYNLSIFLKPLNSSSLYESDVDDFQTLINNTSSFLLVIGMSMLP